MKITFRPPYQQARAAAYPPLTDLADALVKQAAGDNGPMEEYIAKCQAVKDAIPKDKLADE